MLLLPLATFAQHASYVDSLKNALLMSKTPKEKTELNYLLSFQYLSINKDTSIAYADAAIELAKSHRLAEWLSIATVRKGEALSRSGQDSTAIPLFHKVLSLHLKPQFDTILADANWHLGSCYYHFANYDSALYYFVEAVEIYRKRTDKAAKRNLAHVLNNVGNVYYFNDRERAVDYYEESLHLYNELNDTSGRAAQTGNLGLIYVERRDTAKAIAYSEESLRLYRSFKSKNQPEKKRNRDIATSLVNLAYAHMIFGNYDRALEYAESSLSLRKEIDHPKGVAISTDLIGTIYYKMGRYKEAIRYLEESSKLLHEQHLRSYESETLKTLAECYAKEGKLKEAVELYPRAFALLDTIYREESTKLIAEVEGLYQTQKDNKVSLLESQTEVAELKLREREGYLLTATVVTFLLGIISLILFFFYRIRTKANNALEKKNTEISEQKAIIEEKNEHITDSIRYAERLQAAILPKQEMFAKHFSYFNILYLPKDIVSGDFYWMEELNGMVFLAVADCTGHGVPGAMVSMVGFQGLNKAVLEEKLTSPAAILQRLSDHVEEAFEKSGGSVKDGMDICLCAINPKKRMVSYAGAHNALWILTSQNELANANLREEENERRMFELKADRRSIGGFMDAGTFSETTVQLSQGDRLFLFSDGFADQFGGPQGKKMGSKRMRETVRQMALTGNLSQLESTFTNWKGQEEQVDDVTVISVTV